MKLVYMYQNHLIQASSKHCEFCHYLLDPCAEKFYDVSFLHLDTMNGDVYK